MGRTIGYATHIAKGGDKALERIEAYRKYSVGEKNWLKSAVSRSWLGPQDYLLASLPAIQIQAGLETRAIRHEL